jgi:hypothetical protein
LLPSESTARCSRLYLVPEEEVSATKDSLTDDTLAKIRAIPVSPRGGFTMEMYSVKNATESVLQRRAIIFAVCLEEWLKHGLDMAYSCSTSHRRISQIHPKSSGRDIVKNDIMLQAPYNALNISFPSSTENDPESIVSPQNEGYVCESALSYKAMGRTSIFFLLQERQCSVEGTRFCDLHGLG